MDAFRTAAAGFCIACICAEIITLLVGPVPSAKCIKAVAGLYILVVLFRLLPGMLPELKASVGTAPAAVQIEGADACLLRQTQEQLEAALCRECLRRFGVSVGLEIPLETAGQTVHPAGAVLSVPAGCDPSLQQELLSYLRSELGVQPALKIQEEKQ